MDFPFPTTISRDDFQESGFSPDSFLYENHRYTAIDVLIKDLTNLFDGLKGELLNIVNNDYSDFIRLGRSIDGGMDLINSMLIELRDFQKSCYASEQHLLYTHETVEKSLQTKSDLILIKNNVKLCLLLSSQIMIFENLLNAAAIDSSSTPNSTNSIENLKNLTTIYLTINKLYSVLSKLDSQYIVGIKVKVSNIGSEFRNFLNELLLRFKGNKLENKLIVFELMRIYKVIGHEEDFVKLIREK